MKLSVSLPEDDIVILDDYVRATGLASRSAAIHTAVQMLRLPHLEEDYATAWQQWDDSGDDSVWQNASTDGLVDAPR